MVAGLSGLAHTLSTVIIGILVGFIGFRLSEKTDMITGRIAPAVLVVMGLAYVGIDRIRKHHHAHGTYTTGIRGRSRWVIIATLCLAMFFSPCLEIEAYYFQAGTAGWPAIILVSSVYVAVTVAGMVLLVNLGINGVRRVKSSFLEHHEKLVSGLVLVALGIFSWFFRF